MKCPIIYTTMQHNIRKSIPDEDNMINREYQLFIEIQGFNECYKENCAAWDKEKNMCRKVGK